MSETSTQTETATSGVSESAPSQGTTSSEAPVGRVSSHPLRTAGTVTDGGGRFNEDAGRTDAPVKEAASAPESEGKADSESSDDFKDVPEDIRPHAEKAAKKWYTKKTMELAEREKQWTAKEQTYQQQLQQFQTIAADVLQNPSKLEHYKQVFGLHTAQTEVDSLPPEIQTVGDLLDYNKQQMEAYKESLKNELRYEAQSTVQRATAVTQWEQALAVKQKDPFFTRWSKEIVDIANSDPEVVGVFKANNHVEVLDKAQAKFRDRMRVELEEIRDKTLKEQKAKVRGSTQVPIKTTQPLPRSAQTREEVIARVRERLGPPI